MTGRPAGAILHPSGGDPLKRSHADRPPGGEGRLHVQLALSHWRDRLPEVLATGWGIEVQLDDSGLFMEDLEEVAELAAALPAGTPRLAHLPNYGVQLGCKDRTIGETSLAVARKAVAAAAALGCRRAVYHTYLLPTIPSYKLERWLPTFLGRFEELLASAEQAGVRLLVENVWERDGALFDALFARYDRRVGMCLDVGHVRCFSPHDFGWWWGRYAGRVEHVHVSDNDGSEDAHLPPPRGTIPWAEVWPVVWQSGVSVTFELPVAEAAAAWEYLRG